MSHDEPTKIIFVYVSLATKDIHAGCDCNKNTFHNKTNESN